MRGWNWRIASGIGAIVAILAALAFAYWTTYTTAEYVDVSASPGYSARIGERCTVLRGLRAHGFTLDLRRKDLTHEVDVTTLPGVDGPEITFITELRPGTLLVIDGARKCSNCPLGKTDFAVSIPQMPALSKYKVFARLDAMDPTQVSCRR